MHFEFFKQKYEGQISVGDEIAVFSEADDYMSSGRYTVAQLGADQTGLIIAMLVGMNFLEGEICQVPITSHRATTATKENTHE